MGCKLHAAVHALALLSRPKEAPCNKDCMQQWWQLDHVNATLLAVQQKAAHGNYI